MIRWHSEPGGSEVTEQQRQALITRLCDRRDHIRRLSAELGEARAHPPVHPDRMQQFTSAQILRLRIDVALLEAQLAAAA